VLARIEGEGAGATRRSWRAAWVVVPLAAAAILVAVLVPRRARQEETTVRLKPGTSEVRLNPDAPYAKPDATYAKPDAAYAGTTEVRLKPDATYVGTTEVRLTDSAKATSIKKPGIRYSSDVNALAPPPLEVSSIAIDALEPGESMTLPHLQTIEPIAVAPLGDDHGGDRR
jgi:hypothetical protein